VPSREDILANITTGPGRPSRGDILANMTGGAQGPLIDLVRAPKDVPQRTPITIEQLAPRPDPVQFPKAPEPEPGPFEFAGPLGKFIDLIDTPRAAIVSTIKEVGDLFTGEGFSPVDWWKQTEDNLFMQDVMRDWGLDLPGPLDMVLGLGLDIAFDPITYMTGGIGAAGRAGMTAPKLINVMSKGAAWYDDIVKAGGKAGVTATQAAHKSKVLKDGVNAVGRSNAMHSAGAEALKEVGLLGQMGLFFPTTGRLGRAVRLDKVLDKATRGGVTARRASQASKLPYIGELARPVAQGALDDAAEAVARFGAAGAQDAAAAEARIVGRMKDIAKGVDLGDMPDDFYTAAARVAARMPVEAFKLPGFTGKVLTTVVPQFGKAKANLFSRETAKKKAKAGPLSRGIAETIENSFNTKAGLKRGLRSGDYETVLDANRIMVGNNAGWAARNRFMDLMSKDALDLRRSARRLGLEPKQVDDMLKTQYYLTDSLGATVVENGLPVMNPAFQQKFGAVIERAGLSVVADFWTQGRHWMDNALLRANAFGGMNWLASSADELWVMRRALEQAYDPTMQRQLIAGGEFRGIPLMKQADDPLRRTVDEQIKAIAKAEFGDGAEELFDTNIWKAMDVYLSKIGEGVRRSKIMTLLEEGGIAFQEPLTWIKGQKDVAHNALKKQYGARGDLFDEVFRGIEAGLDVEQVKAMRMKIAKREGASEMGEQAAAWVAETEILEAKLVDIQSRLIEAMGDVTRRGRQSKESMHEFMKPLLEEASLIGYRKAQLEAVSRMLMGQQTAATRTITDEKLLAELTEAFAAAAEKMRHLVEDAKSLAEVSTDVQSMKRLLAALQEPLAELDKQGLLDAFPEVPRMREWFGDVFEFRELLNPDPPGPWAKTVPAPGFDVREVHLDGRLYPDIGSIYRDYNGISVNDLPRWMGEAENSWEEVTAAYRGALDRGHGYGASLDEWQQRQALAGGVLLSKDSPFVRLEATLRDGVWSRNVSGGAEVAEGQPLKWSKAPSEEVPFASRPLREPKYSIPSEKELLIKYRSVTNVDEATRMTLEERQALRLREAKAWTDAGKHVGSKPRTTLPGESAMSVREVDGRRQIDVWTVEPHGTVQTVEEFGKEVDKWVRDGWVVSVNGEEVGRVGSLNEAKELAQAEATKRLGVAPTARAVAAEAVTPPPAAASTRSALTNRADELNEQLSRALDEGGFIADDGSGDILLDLSDLEARKSYSPEMRDLLDEIDEVDRLLAARSAEAVTPPPAAAAGGVAARRAAARRKVFSACTGDKCPMVEGATVAAEDLYTGETFKYLRRQIDGSDAELGGIISAKHGVLDPTEMVGSYDVQLPKTGAKEVVAGPEQLQKFADLVGGAEELFFYGPAAYRALMRDLLKRAQARGLVGEHVRVVEAKGGIGQIKESLGKWAGEGVPAPTAREVAAEAVTPPAGGPVWRDLAGYKKGDAYELVADLNASEGVMLPRGRSWGEVEPTMFRIRRSKGKAGGWTVWYKREGMEKFEKVADGGNVRVPAKSNPDKTVAVPGVWETLEDAKAHVDSLVGDAPTARVAAAEAVTPPPATPYQEYALGEITREEMLEATAEAVTPPAAAAPTAREIRIVRHAEPDAQAFAEGKPQGLYVTPLDEAPPGGVSAHRDLGEPVYATVMPKNPLEVPQAKVTIPERAAFWGSEYEADAGVSALRHLLDDAEWGRLLRGDGELRKDHVERLLTELEERFPGFDYRRMIDEGEDAYSLLGVYGSRLASEQGYDVIILRGKQIRSGVDDPHPVVGDEMVVLDASLIRSEGAPKPPAAATRAPDPSGMYGPKGAPRFDEAIVRTPFGDFRLRFVGKRTGQGVEILDAPSGLMASPAKTGEKVPGTRAPLGPGVKFKNYAAAESRIDGWAQEVFENRWTGAEAQGAVGATFLDPARQGGVRQALATLTGRTETTGFPGGIEEGLSWLDEPMWRMPLEQRMAFTEAERDVLIQAERLNHLAYALADYEKAEAAMRVGLTVEAEIATMQGRLRQLQAEFDVTKEVYEAAGANLREPGGRKDLAHQGLAPKDVAELFDGTRTDMDYFQAALRKFNTSRGKDLFDKSLTQQTAAQWGPNSVDPKWSRGWSAPLGDGGGEAAPVFEMLNALFKTSSSSGDFGAFLKWYDKFLNYWKAQAVSTPGFVIRNGLGGSWLSYAFGLMELGSTNKFAGVFFKASKLGEGNAVKGVDEMIKALGISKKKSVSVGFGSRVDINELRTIRRVLDSGIVGGGQVITEVDRNVAMRLVRESRNPITNQPIDVVFNPASTEFAPFRFIRSSNEQMETVLRGALAFDVLQKGGSVADAAGQVYKFHFNYADLTSMERKMRRIIPFWTWQKNVVPILVESLGKHPYAWGRLQQVKGNLELQSKEEGVVPDYFLENMAIRLPWKINDYQSYWIPDLPFRDLNRLMKEPGSITRVFAESAAPPVKVPLEIWAGKQFFADLPFSGRYQQVPHVYAKFPFLMDALSLAGKAKKDKKGEYKMRDQDLYMMDSWMPFLSRFRRLLPNESRYSRRVASTVVSTVFGTQVRVNDPHETRNQIIRNDRAFDEKMRDLIDIEMRVR